MVARRFIYKGSYSQSGQGLGLVLQKLARTAIPAVVTGIRNLVKNPAAQSVAKNIGVGAVNTLAGAIRGKSIGQTAKTQLRKAQKRIANEAFGKPSKCITKKRTKKLSKRKPMF